MHIYRCRLILQEPLFFATREVGRLYETGRYLHNYALAYAFGFVRSPWFHAEQVPHYAADLSELAGKIYITPAEPEEVIFHLVTFKYGEELLHVEMQQAERNTPSFGRAKELAPESSFCCYVLSEEALALSSGEHTSMKPGDQRSAQNEPRRALPRWIRLGKWHSKTRVDVEPINVNIVDGRDGYRAACPLNPLDVPVQILRAFDIVSMPPSSLVTNAHCAGQHYNVGAGIGLPVNMRFS